MVTEMTAITAEHYLANINSYSAPISNPNDIANTIEEIMNSYDIALEKTIRFWMVFKKLDW